MDFYAAVNTVHSGFIRTEADEVHYNLHILLRFELERELIAGTLEAEDLEEAWNSRFARDFGETVPDPSLGVLQDVHWSIGLFGYFPTYSLGNIYAACSRQGDAPGPARPRRHGAGRRDAADPRLDARKDPQARPSAAGRRNSSRRQPARHRPHSRCWIIWEAKFGALYGL